MRKDMGKVVIERPRYGHSKRSVKARHMTKIFYRNNIREDFEDSSEYCDWDHDGFTRYSGKKAAKFSRDNKSSTDLLGPIKKFLRSSCGKYWNDVYSEACEVMSGRNIAISHVLDHMKNMVYQHNDYEKIGDEYYHARWHGYSLNYRHGIFIVDENGILKYIPPKYTHKSKRKNFIKIIEVNRESDSLSTPKYYLKIDGVWYEVSFYDQNRNIWNREYIDQTLEGKTVLKYNGNIYTMRKNRTLSKKEIKNLHKMDNVIYDKPEIYKRNVLTF